eukprot:1983241-Pyramimonas_sp.AAC.1
MAAGWWVSDEVAGRLPDEQRGPPRPRRRGEVPHRLLDQHNREKLFGDEETQGGHGAGVVSEGACELRADGRVPQLQVLEAQRR